MFPLFVIVGLFMLGHWQIALTCLILTILMGLEVLG